jgi:NAD(P)-dependent dehydrogenase (short-subunit alcohol dehydrogenase family)
MGTHDGRYVIVNGAAGGIGGAVVRRLLEAGACVLAADRDVVDIERSERLEPGSADLNRRRAGRGDGRRLRRALRPARPRLPRGGHQRRLARRRPGGSWPAVCARVAPRENSRSKATAKVSDT